MAHLMMAGGLTSAAALFYDADSTFVNVRVPLAHRWARKVRKWLRMLKNLDLGAFFGVRS